MARPAEVEEELSSDAPHASPAAVGRMAWAEAVEAAAESAVSPGC